MKFTLKIGLLAVLVAMVVTTAYAGGEVKAQGVEAKIIDLLQRKGIITASEAEELKKELITEEQKEKDKTRASFKVPQIGSDKMKIGGMIKFRNSHYR